MGDDMDDIIILIDENGSEVEAEYIDTIKYNGNAYVVLLPRDAHGGGGADAHAHNGAECDCEEEEVVILKVEQGVDGEEEAFVAIEDENEQNAVFEIFQRRMDEMDQEFDYEDEDAGDEDDEDE